MTELNGVMMQYFQWYLPDDGSHWKRLIQQAQELASAGFTAVWLPPAYKGSGGIQDVGYTPYDLFDLGEFDQKGTVRTKYGTRQEYLEAIQAVHEAGMEVYADAVFHQKAGGDLDESFEAILCEPDNRNCAIAELETIQAKTHFTFPGRNGKHSAMQWHWWHFDSVNHNLKVASRANKRAIYRFTDKTFETELDARQTHAIAATTCYPDTQHPEVLDELQHWGEWMFETAKVDGFRLTAANQLRPTFFSEWLVHLRRYAKRKLFAVGDYWAEDVESLHAFISRTGGQLSVFDVPLHYNFHRASRAGGHFDMRRLLFGTLMREQPALAVTFVENHDSQPLQTLESVVEPWFKPLAYALLLLRREGYPCVFYGDYYGGHYVGKGRDGKPHEVWLNSHRWLLDRFLYARRHCAYGEQYDYFDHPDCIGWSRLGNPDHPGAMAVIMSDGAGGSKWMEVGKPNTRFYDITEHIAESVTTNEYGWGDFPCSSGSVSVWLELESAFSG